MYIRQFVHQCYFPMVYNVLTHKISGCGHICLMRYHQQPCCINLLSSRVNTNLTQPHDIRVSVYGWRLIERYILLADKATPPI